MTAAHVFPDERRAHPRHRVFKWAKAVFNAHGSVVDCVMRDLSAGGARLSCASAAQLPEQFQLLFVAERELRDVRVAWRSLTELGVQFLSPPRKALHLLV
ncbi:PilZ domain-containing protein [Aestuariivirga litoralis]|uniref:PilZ domain-containing protein n=1 Tax=Aestuariivirga litoralis TaxID=2650924 RepID=A0A2W2AN76_9HYPH|nr:PilZ domain-containing protein [Aestuariivirga litoralis]PZF76831.1 PilZ domain-containing protein [Aestuariivirga litoralis]